MSQRQRVGSDPVVAIKEPAGQTRIDLGPCICHGGLSGLTKNTCTYLRNRPFMASLAFIAARRWKTVMRCPLRDLHIGLSFGERFRCPAPQTYQSCPRSRPVRPRPGVLSGRNHRCDPTFGSNTSSIRRLGTSRLFLTSTAGLQVGLQQAEIGLRKHGEQSITRPGWDFWRAWLFPLKGARAQQCL